MSIASRACARVGAPVTRSPNGSRHWRYRYHFRGREKMMSLGSYPEVPTESAWARHRAARQLLAWGIDPVSRRNALRQISTERSDKQIADLAFFPKCEHA